MVGLSEVNKLNSSGAATAPWGTPALIEVMSIIYYNYYPEHFFLFFL